MGVPLATVKAAWPGESGLFEVGRGNVPWSLYGHCEASPGRLQGAGPG